MESEVKTTGVGAAHGVFRRLPKPIKPWARLAYYMAAIPFRGRRSWNRFKYQISVSKTERINFVPPIFSIAISSTCNLRCPNCFYVLLGGEHAFEGGAQPVPLP